MPELDKTLIRSECMAVSPLVKEVSFCPCSDRCKNPTVYIKYLQNQASYYHCCAVSVEGLLVNSNGHHPFEVHDAMGEAIKIVRKHLGV